MFSGSQSLAKSRTEARDDVSRSSALTRPLAVGISDRIKDTASSALDMLRHAK